MSRLPNTPSQTAGPYLSMGFEWTGLENLSEPGTEGSFELEGQVLDGSGEPVSDAAVELWQADEEGRYPPRSRPGWHGFARCLTDEEGHYRFRTLKPGPTRTNDGGLEAPHIEVQVFARGLLRQLFTRIYFPDEAEANASDPALNEVPDEAARDTLVAARTPTGYHFDIVLQGERETVFFEP